MKLAKTGSLTLIALASQTFLSLSRASSCNTINSFNNYNATRTYPIPALRINGSRSGDPNYYKILKDPNSLWYITDRFTGASSEFKADGTQFPWLNIGDSNTTNIGMCMDTTWTYVLGEYKFFKEVLERSVNDNGDCKTMLGEECVSALESHYRRDAMESMTRGRCSTASEWNTTVPFQCASLIGGGERWLGGMFSSGSNLNVTLAPQKYNISNCPLSTSSPPLNSSMFGGSGTGGSYDQSIRFPQPWFFTFWPNRTGETTFQTSSSEDVYVKIMCLRPDDVREGSAVPPSVEELLKRDDVKFDRNLMSGGDGGGGGGGGGNDKTGGANVMGLPNILGAAGMLAALLI